MVEEDALRRLTHLSPIVRPDAMIFAPSTPLSDDTVEFLNRCHPRYEVMIIEFIRRHRIEGFAASQLSRAGWTRFVNLAMALSLTESVRSMTQHTSVELCDRSIMARFAMREENLIILINNGLVLNDFADDLLVEILSDEGYHDPPSSLKASKWLTSGGLDVL